jgi:CheY-like chemotaxis protein
MPPAPAAPAPSHRPRKPPPEPRRVLIVEDDEDGREALVRLCQRTGHDCLSAANRAEALAIIVSRAPDAIVLDLMLPDGSGVEVLRLVRAHGFPVRVAVVTAASNPALLAEVQKLRPDALFRKPVSFQDLRAWLDAR